MKTNKVILPIVVVASLLVTSGTAFFFNKNQKMLEEDIEQLRKSNHDLAHQLVEKAKPAASKPKSVAPANEAAGLESEQAELALLLSEKNTRIAELEAQLRAKPKTVVASKPVETEKEVPAWQRFEDRMNKMKAEDPERYKHMQEARANFKTTLKDNVARKSAFLMNLDAEKMTDEERENHEKLMGIMETTWALQEKMGDGEMDAKVMFELQSEFRSNMHDMGSLLESERQFALGQLAESMGYKDEEAGEFTSYINDVVEMTSMRSFFKGMRPSGRGGSKDKKPEADGPK